LAKYMAMANVLFEPLEFGRRIFIERVDTAQNPADALTRHPLLNKFLAFAKSATVEVCAVSSEPTGYIGPYGVEPEVCAAVSNVRSAALPSLSDIANEQRSDPQIQVVKTCLSDHTPPCPQVHRSYILVWHTLLVREGLLMRHISAVSGVHPNDVIVVPVVPSSLINRVLLHYHDPDGCSHIGIHRVIEAVKRNYWFPGLSRAVCDHVANCKACNQQQLRQIWKQEGVQRVAPPGPWHTVAADTVSVSTPRGRLLLLTVLCQFSHWPEVYVLRTKSSMEIANCFRNMNARYGDFSALTTDQGSEFKGSVQQYLDSIGAKHSTTLSFTPVAAIEQFNRTLLQKLQAVFYTPAWSRLSLEAIIDEILWSLRSTPSTVHHTEPFLLMFGRLPRTRERLKTSAYLQKLEKVEDVLSEQRALAVNRKPVQECLPSGSLVYVRLHDPDRRFKVGKKWTTMTVLRQDGNKVYLSM
ncbi:hypothetical protein FOZ63_009385, partial [Perkinsus olseni]